MDAAATRILAIVPMIVPIRVACFIFSPPADLPAPNHPAPGVSNCAVTVLCHSMITLRFLFTGDLSQTTDKTTQTPKAPVPIGHLSLKALRSAGLNPLQHSHWFIGVERSTFRPGKGYQDFCFQLDGPSFRTMAAGNRGPGYLGRMPAPVFPGRSCRGKSSSGGTSRPLGRNQTEKITQLLSKINIV
jgi:hypothetical protein